MLIRLLPICLFNLFIRHLAKALTNEYIQSSAGQLAVSTARLVEGKRAEGANTGISNNKPTKILLLDRQYAKGRQFLRSYSMLANSTAGNIHKMFVI